MLIEMLRGYDRLVLDARPRGIGEIRKSREAQVIDDLLHEVQQRSDLSLLMAWLSRLKPLLNADVDRAVVLALLARRVRDGSRARNN